MTGKNMLIQNKANKTKSSKVIKPLFGQTNYLNY